MHIESKEILYDNRLARLVTATDVTEKTKSDELLAEANMRLKSASDIANLGYWSHDLRTSEIYWSDTLFSIFDIDKNSFELTWENVRNVFHAENKPQLDMDEIFNNNETKEFEHRIMTGKGNDKWILERLSLIRDNEGIPIFLEGIALDITERKRAIDALESSNERFRMVARATVEAIIDWNLETGDVFWGDGFLELFGYEPGSAGKTLWVENIFPKDRIRVLKNLANAISGKTTQDFFDNFRFIKANGQIAFVEQRGVFIRNSDGVAIRAIGAMIDVTQLKERMLMIEEQNQQLREIAWVQSHVVRGPLATLMGLANLLKENEKYQLDQNETIGQMIACANKLDNVVRDIVKRTEQIERSAVCGTAP